MSDTITVTFGGREVVLKHERHGLYANGQILVNRWERGFWVCRLIGHTYRAHGTTAQVAATALESKLRVLRDQLNEALGTSAPADRPS